MKKRATKQTQDHRSAISGDSEPHQASNVEMFENAQSMLKSIETKALSNESVQKELDKLITAYREVSINNKVKSKHDEILQQEITDLQQKNSEASEEVKDLRQQYHSFETKVEKLESLSRMLSNRVKSVESKANEDAKAGQDGRLRSSHEFSAKIKDISAKLEDLNKRRESIITENAQLKEVLRQCFDRFDNDPDFHQSSDEIDKTNFMDFDSDTELDSEQRAQKRERKTMEDHEDQTRLKILREQEEFLRQKSTKYMDVFETFQQRLTESNRLFKLKQGRVEEMTKDIKGYEKQNQDLSTRIAECTLSSKALSDTVGRLLEEKERYMKLIEKQQSLIEKFQEDITSLESSR